MKTNFQWDKDFIRKLRSKIVIGGPDDCWEWTGAIVNSKKPYGIVKIEGKNKLVHRVIYELYSGEELTEGIQVCHSCDNPRCCNPRHLWKGTNADNMHDKVVKGRASHLGGLPAKFTFNKWQEIRRLYYIEGWSKCRIGREFNAYDTTIRRVLESGDNYKCKERQ